MGSPGQIVNRDHAIPMAIFYTITLPLMVAFTAALSVTLVTRGLSLPWVHKVYQQGFTVLKVDPLPAVLLGALFALLATFLTSSAVRRKEKRYHLYGLILIIISVATTVVAMYGGVCATCTSALCGGRGVQQCVMLWRNIFEVIMKCVCR